MTIDEYPTPLRQLFRAIEWIYGRVYHAVYATALRPARDAFGYDPGDYRG